MSRKIKITDFKTKRINKLSGGKIGKYCIKDYPKSKDDDGCLENSFLSKDNIYLGSYSEAWWYIQKKMVVCNKHPHGCSIILKSYSPKIIFKNALKDPFENWFTEQLENDNIVGYYGYSHRGGQTFKIGDRFFSENYEPIEKDYTKKEWSKFKDDRKKAIDRDLKEGWIKTIEEGLKETPLSSVIPFKMRGNKVIKNWTEARQAAINISKYLS